MREAIRREVIGITPLDEEEAETQKAVLRWIDSGAELCRMQKPDVPPQHLIAYFAVVDGDHVLLVDHINAELWLPTGGHVEPGEHPRETVVREALEELAIQASFLQSSPLFLTRTETVGKTAGHVDVSLWYVLRGNRRTPIRFDVDEFVSVRWFHRSEIPLGRSDPQMPRFLAKLYA